jgi:LysM repeat protein
MAGGETAPAPGETVVSAVTPVPQETDSGLPATQVPVGETPATLPEATAAPGATDEPSAPAPAQPSGGEANTIWHTVQQGETLSSIARRYGTTWQKVAQANGLVNPNQIYAGQKLKIPAGSAGSPGGSTGCRLRHTVRQGEWVWQIARTYGVSPYDILAANGLTIQTANTIYPGAVLCIP